MTDSEPHLHRNDIYGAIDNVPSDPVPAIPAATVVLIRDGLEGPEVLMLHRTSKVHFGGMWVFPGGRIDPEDQPANGDPELAARNAATRESMEEANISLDPDNFVWFAHWCPPPSQATRYATWFFATVVGHDHDIDVDGHEIQAHEWIRPADALSRHSAGDIDLAPPTWVTLHDLSRAGSAASLLEHLRSSPRKVYETHIGVGTDGIRIAMWSGDAGYEASNPDLAGRRHRLIMAKSGFRFENTM